MADDGREYYAINYDCNWSKADQWVKDNVIAQLPDPPLPQMYSSAKQYQKTEAYKQGWRNKITIASEVKQFVLNSNEKPEFWADYASYDWVVFCQLFGTMMDLPKGFPMYCNDLQQTLKDLGSPELPKQKEGQHNALADARHCKVLLEFLEQQ